MKSANKSSPFPIHDTEEIRGLELMIEHMDKTLDYDDIPVVACKYCKSLHIINDDLDNDICAKCGSFNEIDVYDTIINYLDETQQG